MISKILDLIYPPKCGICGKLDSNYLCKKCQKRLENEAIWEIKENKNLCICFEELLAIFKYENISRNEIIRYKFNEKSYLYKTFVNFLIKNKNICKKIKSYDTIVPVPISKKRNKERGYNQSYLLAKEISEKLGIEINNSCLYKYKNTIEQSKLNKQEREKNAQNVYKLKNKEILKDKKILLLDDIYTTGNTVNECSRILMEANPKKIGVIVLAKD